MIDFPQGSLSFKESNCNSFKIMSHHSALRNWKFDYRPREILWVDDQNAKWWGLHPIHSKDDCRNNYLKSYCDERLDYHEL